MYKLKNFSTKKNIVDQLIAGGVTEIKMPFDTTNLGIEKNPFKTLKLKTKKGKEVKATVYKDLKNKLKEVKQK